MKIEKGIIFLEFPDADGSFRRVLPWWKRLAFFFLPRCFAPITWRRL